jgi:hypothetical protein
VADSDALRTRRSRAHRAGDHSLCLPTRCRALGAPPTPKAGDVSDLEKAVREEFGEADPLSLALALRLVTLGGGPGVAGVNAVRALAELVAAQREPSR